MRSRQEVEDFEHELQAYMEQCERCGGTDLRCECVLQATFRKRVHEAGVPRDFWDLTERDVKYNSEVFEEVIKPYIDKLGRALKHGYGLMLLGDNGVGKSFFLSLVLMAVCRRGWSAFYTTMPQLAHDTRRGFNNRETQERLDWYLTSDFVAIDEMGKERFKTGDSFMRVEMERILKQRYDDARPTLIATNADMDELGEMYGATIMSAFNGKYQIATLEPGDFREVVRQKMKDDMG